MNMLSVLSYNHEKAVGLRRCRGVSPPPFYKVNMSMLELTILSLILPGLK